jgi:hypothetical protein
MSDSATSLVAQVPSPVSRRAILLRTILGLVVLLVVVRLLLPWLLDRAFNPLLLTAP